MPDPPLPRTLLAIALLLFLTVPARADIIHLTNGGSIHADSWEQAGDELIIHQGSGTIVIPRAEVERIEATGESAQPAPGTPETGRSTPAAESAPPITSAGPSRDEVLARIKLLERKIRDFPLARDANTRELVGLLNYLGERSYIKRDYDEALHQFREAQSRSLEDPRAGLGLGATYFALGQDLYARSVLERALLHNPDHPRLLTLLGDVYNSQERTEDALEVWEKAQAVRPDDAVHKRLETLRRQLAIDHDYRRSEAAHFTLKTDGERAGPDLEEQILEFLEDRFPDLVTRFDHYPSQPIVVIVYPARQFYEATLAEKNVAGLFDGKIRVPSGGLKQLTREARKVLLHELAHAFIAGKSGRTAPRWLHEGIAQLIEGRTTPRPVAIAMAKRFEEARGSGSWGRTFSYPSALSFVEYLESREGFFRLVEVLVEMSRGTKANMAFQEVTRYSLDELRTAWGEDLAGRYLP